MTARFTHGRGADNPLIMERDLDGSGTFDAAERFTFLRDAQGSITELTDQTGAVVAAYVYDSFGRIAQQTGNLVSSYTFTGREFDEESGLYFLRARYYDPASGRFIKEDPIGLSGGLNGFSYAEANPTDRTDRFGLFTPGRHYEITVNAGRAAGLSQNQAAGLANRTMLVDFQPDS